MILIVGLGNPGKKYEKTRHNIGHLLVDRLVFLNQKGIILQKSKSFMNESGKTVKLLIKKYKLKTKNIIIIHDDLDLPLGKIRIVKNRGSAGHRGVESIIQELKTKDFARIRIGIQPKMGKPHNPEKFVLQKFTKEEEEILEETIKKTALVIQAVTEEGLVKAMNQYNR